MTDTLAQLLDKVQAQLLDDGKRYPDAALTVAVRSALAALNQSAPRKLTVEADGVDNSLLYEMGDLDASALNVLGVWLKSTMDDCHTPLVFDVMWGDGALFFRLRESVTGSDTLLVSYTSPHTLNGLDSATTSTLPAWRDQVLVDGACAFACANRATYLAESVNVNKDVVNELRKSAAHFNAQFIRGLADMAKEPSTVAEPSTAAWNDEYYGWDG